MSPIKFSAIYQERVWGGRDLERVYGRVLPCEGVPYGESWEISDREEDQSVVSGGEFEGLSLNDLWKDDARKSALFGEGLMGDRFPLLIKILDCREDLSVQVHPPVALEQELGGEAKTEMWYMADVDEGASLYAGVKNGVTEESFRKALESGGVEQEIHSIKAEKGDSIFIPSGRLHAIGAGHLIYEIQQNSDTTYRVYDWGRLGLNGEPRELHVEQSIRCIDFTDVEPSMDVPVGNTLASCEYFKVDKFELPKDEVISNPCEDRFSIITVVSGELSDADGQVYRAGEFMILPRGASCLKVDNDAVVLQTTIPV